MMRILPAILLFAILATPLATAQNLDCVTYADLPAPGPSCAVGGVGVYPVAAPLGADHLVFRAGSLLEVYDLSGAGAPVLVGTLDGPESTDQQLAVLGSYAYLPAIYGETSVIVDLTDPADPVIVGDLGQTYGAFSVDGDRVAAEVYAPLEGNVVHILDCSDPLAPVLLATVEAEGDVSLQGDVLAVMNTGITVFDIGDLAAPTEILSIDYPVEQMDNGAYSYFRATFVKSVEFLADKMILATRYHSSYGSWIYGNYTATNTYGRKRYDISDPAAPVLEAARSSHVDSNVFAFGNYNLTRHGGLMIESREVFDPLSSDLAPLAVLPVRDVVPGGVMHLGAADLVVCDGVDLTRVALDAVPADNVGDPLVFGNGSFASRQACVGGFFTFHIAPYDDEYGGYGTCWRLYSAPVTQVADGDCLEYWTPHAVKAAGSSLLVDATFYRVEPDLARTEFDIDFGATVSALTFDPTGTLVASNWGTRTLRITDVSDPAAPVILGETTLPMYFQGISDLVWQGDRILVVAASGLGIVAVSDLAAPALLGIFSRPGLEWAVFGPGDTALMLAVDQLVLVDFTDPTQPQVTAERRAGILAAEPLVQGDYAYTSTAELISVYEVTTLQPLGSLHVDDTVVGLDYWNDQPVGARNGYAYLPPACEAVVTGATDPDLPAATALLGVHPNPFNPRTTVSFALDRDQPVRLAVYDLRGRRTAVLADGQWPAGVHRASWDGRDRSGSPAAAGVYLLRLESATGVQTAKAVLVK